MRFGSLFAGIGGLDLGLERAGMECVWQVEIDDYYTKVLEKHWPDVRRYRNVREVGSNLEPVDLIAGGFPCQPHSVAGKRKGAADDRNLWPEFIRIIRETRPRYVLAENVPGIITTYLDTVLSDLEGEGYTCATFNLPACGFDAPHRRERIFIVAYCQDKGDSGRQWLALDDAAKSPAGGNEPARGRGYDGREVVADTRHSFSKTSGDGENQRRTGTSSPSGKCDGDVPNTPGERLEGQESEGGNRRQSGLSTECSWWTVEPRVGRVAHGIPSRVDRLRGLGNAVVPQVAEWIGRRIIEHANQ